jgi:hypothetical protein
MRRTLFFTTMVNHRPVSYSTSTTSTDTETKDEPRQFHKTAARDPNNPNPNIPGQPALRDMLARSTQPIFSVSAMFGVRSGGGCGACGH